MIAVATAPLPPIVLPPHPQTPPGPSPTHHRQQVVCPTCGDPVASLLAACFEPACLTADLDYDALFDRQDDIG